MKPKHKFSGMSFGGRYPGVTIRGKKHKAIFGKLDNSKREKKRFGKMWRKNGYGFCVKKKRFGDIFMSMMIFVLFPLIDLSVFSTYYILSNVKIKVPSVIISAGQKLSTIPPIFQNILLIVWFVLWLFLIYYLVFRGVRKWHGTEHKLIASAENNDIENAKKYSPIHERCGGTLMPTILLGYIIWMFIYSRTGIIFGGYSIIGVLIFCNIKFFHKYDKIGIWFGKLLQKYVTVKEPNNWQLSLGKVAMKNLYLAEEGKEYKKIGVGMLKWPSGSKK